MKPKLTPADWNHQYRDGTWRYLASTEQAGRYAIIATLIRQFAAVGGVFDLGCGEGLLLDYLSPEMHRLYRGLDVSSEAVCMGARRWPQLPAEAFSVGRVEEFDYSSMSETTVVVFNEVLYYVPEPGRVLEAALSAGANVIISICLKRGKLYEDLSAAFGSDVRQSLYFSFNTTGKAWHIASMKRAIRPSVGSGPGCSV